MEVVKQTWIILGLPRQVSESKEYLTLKHLHKMVKQTQIIRRRFADELFECV